MPRFTTLILWLVAVFTLSACDTVRSWTGSSGNQPVSPRSASGTAATRLPSSYSAPAPAAVPSDAAINRMASQSDSSVEVFSLDGAAPAGSMTFSSPSSAPFAPPAVQSTPLGGDGGVPSVSRDYQGVPLASDPSVTIFPIDGDMTAGAAGIFASQPDFAQARRSSAMMPEPSEAVSRPSTGPVPPPRTGKAVSSVYFPYGSADLGGKDRTALNDIAETAKFAPVDRVRIEGHASPDTQSADPVEARILNLRESLKRAGTVSEKLIQKGVPAEKIETVGWGDTIPAGGNEQQRRVDIVTGGQ